MPDLRNYHVVLKNGTERNVRAKSVEIGNNGVLEFSNGSELVVAYNKEDWSLVETEQKDDKG